VIAIPLALPGLWRLRTQAARDERGAFTRLWCAADFARAGHGFEPVQVSLSETPVKGTLRGLHWQADPHGETKLVRVLRGEIFDVLVDLRRDQPTFGAHVCVEMQAGDGVLVPPGVAHGFLTRAPDVMMVYAMDRDHEPAAARGLRYDDPALAIHWPEAPGIVGARDLTWPPFADLHS
jgi:dTDP-4-dehydrorhamnose 3,5-epimerase